MARRTKKSSKGSPALILLCLALAIGAFYFLGEQELAQEPVGAPAQGPAAPTQIPSVQEGQLEIRFIDVGKADAMLLMCEGEAMLIDAGEAQSGAHVAEVLRDAGVERLRYAVATHPHEDHIGGMPLVLETFGAQQTLLSPRDHTTRAYEKLLLAAEEFGGEVSVPEPGDTFSLGGAGVEVLAPLKAYNELNDNSLVLKITYGARVFLFTGDAESPSEGDMAELYGEALACDLLKVGHHGSNTSSRVSFLDAAAPEYAVISCGLEEEGDGPSDPVLQRLRERGIQIYTTQAGMLTVVCDGRDITFSGTPLPRR